MSAGLDVRAFPSQDELAPVLATAVARDLVRAIDRRGRGVLAVSGGSTPVPFFECLKAHALDWSRVIVTLVDERWVDEDHRDSNAALVRRHLLQGGARVAQFQPLKNAAGSAAEGCPETEALLRPLCPPDVVVLGMGADGHTASWFPGASNLAQALDADAAACCLAITPPGASHERLTLSLAALAASGHLYLHIAGAEKWRTLEQALLPGPLAELPVRAVLLRRLAPAPQVFYAVKETL